MKHLERALDGQNNFWKYLLMAVVVFIGGNLIGSIPLLIVGIVAGWKNGNLDIGNLMDFSAMEINSSLTLALLAFVFAVMLLTFKLSIRPLHHRTLNETINGRSTFRWSRVWVGVVVWGTLNVTLLLLDVLLLSPEDYRLQFNVGAFIPLLLVVLLILPFQTTFEEVFFRGYFSQGLGAWTKNRWVTLLIVSSIFGLLHVANPEVKEYGLALMMPQYILMGLMLGLISMLDDGIELAIGIHFINNAFAALFVTHRSAVFQTNAVFEVVNIDPESSLYESIVVSVIALFVLWRIYKWDFGIMNKKIGYDIPPLP